MATDNYDIDRAAVNMILLEMVEEILVNKMEGAFADETDEFLVHLVAPLYYLPLTRSPPQRVTTFRPWSRSPKARLSEARTERSRPKTSRRSSPRTVMERRAATRCRLLQSRSSLRSQRQHRSARTKLNEKMEKFRKQRTKRMTSSSPPGVNWCSIILVSWSVG